MQVFVFRFLSIDAYKESFLYNFEFAFKWSIQTRLLFPEINKGRRDYNHLTISWNEYLFWHSKETNSNHEQKQMDNQFANNQWTLS